jgi:hypothetical protein
MEAVMPPTDLDSMYPFARAVDEGLADLARQAQPEPIRCSCDRTWPWTWYVPERNGQRYAGRWAAPKVDPCGACALPSEHLVEKALRATLVRIGVSDRLVAYSFDGLVQQGDSEDPDAFRLRVREQQVKKPVLGVPVGQRHAWRELRKWKPPTWVVLHGPPGTGKTTMMAAMARRVLSVASERWEERGGRRVLVRRTAPAVEYHSLDDVLSRERVRHSGLDKSPVKDVATVGVGVRVDGEQRFPVYDRRAVLFLDELGLNSKIRDDETMLVERIIGFRERHGLCTVVATNREYDEVAGPESIYGRRVGNRLATALNVPLTGDSWRETA